MTISELTLKSSDHAPARRFEVFTGSGRRREWLPEEKARIVAESYEAGATVSAVARRYALSPQQLFAWRRAARQPLAEAPAPESLFVPAVIAAPGRIEIDSNTVERSIRPIALNRKNVLFAGSDGGAEHWQSSPR